jgi:iron complex outermembrane receptor protein
VNPVAGVTYRANSNLNVYASYGKGFETPTLNDLAYRSINGSLPGLNTALKPARSNNYEVGVKAGSGHVRADLAAFYIKTVDELAVLQNSSGRTVDQNIGATQRRGLELALDADWVGGFSSRLAYTYIRAVVEQSYYTCIAAPCNPLPSLANPATPLPANYRLVGAGNSRAARKYMQMTGTPRLRRATGWPMCALDFSRNSSTGGCRNTGALITSRIEPMSVR